MYLSADLHRDHILLRCYDEGGKRVSQKIKYQPSLYAHDLDNNTPKPDIERISGEGFKTLDGKSVDRLLFKNIWEAREYYNLAIATNRDIYGMEKWVYPFLNERYPGKIEYNAKKIRIGYLDIECDSEAGFPDISVADQKITAISVRLNGKTWTFGYGEFRTADPTIHYFQCENEVMLLESFLKCWGRLGLDVVSGYNVEFFDVPYLVHRIQRILKEKNALRLSPWRLLRKKKTIIRGKVQETYVPVGITVLDFMQLYQKFAYTRAGQDSFKESKALNYVAHKELGEKKLDYTEYKSLTDLYKQNHQKFIEYNIRDNYLVDRLNQKLRFIELVFSIAYDAKVNFSDALTSVRLWDVICHNYLMDQRIVVPKPIPRATNKELEGAYCKDPDPKGYDWVMSFDVTSLYPHLAIECNISPETFLSKASDVSVEGLLNKTCDIPWGREVVTLAANGTMYRKDRQGFVPALMERKFRDRAEYRRLQAESEKNGDAEQAKVYDSYQLATKITLNSFYGAIANPGFRYHSIDFAGAITHTGQLAIQWVIKHINGFLNAHLGTSDVDYVIAADTDSMMLHMAPLVQRELLDGKEIAYGVVKFIEPTKNDILNFLDRFAKEMIEPQLEIAFKDLASYLNAYKQALRMKREIIADRAIWTTKKRYIMNVWDKEGKRYHEPKLKVMGLEAVRSTTPELSRNAIIEAIRIIMGKDEKTLREFVENFKGTFYASPFDAVAFPIGISDIEKWYDDAREYRSSTPIHNKAAVTYNRMIARKGLTHEPEIYSGSKIRFCHLIEPNPSNSPVVAAPDFLPKALGLDEYIDYGMQWDKTFYSPLKRITDAIGWKLEEENTLAEFYA